ncbi:MAG: gamma-glutamyltransferase [Chloroflexota bacterium]
MRMMGQRGMVASPHYLASGAGLAILRRGGSAVDAAIATNAVLAVVTPYMCGIGGDLFAQVYSASDDSLIGLNGSGRAPATATPERMRELVGADHLPARGPHTVTVPGCVEAWGALHERFGKLPLTDILEDAITYARDGFPVSAAFSRAVDAIAPILHPQTPARETFLPRGHAPHEGEILTQTRIARTLEAIAHEGPDVYYRGWIAEEIVRAHQSVGGLLSLADLDEHRSEWVEPLSVRYRDLTVYDLPPNSQGVIALLMLNILEQLPQNAIRDGGEQYVHTLAEVSRLAHSDRTRHITDPDYMSIEPLELLREEYALELAARIGDKARGPAVAGAPGGTIYLCTADSDGNLVSMIESNWMGIGSGIMAGETGVMLQNRGHWFSLDPQQANVIAPRKRTMHTLVPGMAFRNGKPWLVFGTMGGSGQAQIHMQLLTRLIDQGLALDEAIAAPRFDAVVGADNEGNPAIDLESGFSAELLQGLRRRGHGVRVSSATQGHAHAIQILDDGVYVGASDPRAESLAVGY